MPIYDVKEKKDAKRRFNTIYNSKDFLDNNSKSFLERLDKKIDRTLTYLEDPSIPRTNNTIERYFGITLSSNIKRIYRTVEGLTRWLRIQRIRWIKRNVLNIK